MNANRASASQNAVVVVVADVEMAGKITKKSMMSDVLNAKPEAAEILFEAGMGCIGCPAAMMETLEQGCKAHGMKDKDIEKLVDEINKKK